MPVLALVVLYLIMPLSLTGSKAVFGNISIYAADTQIGASTASELAEQVT